MSLLADFKEFLINGNFKVGDHIPGEIELAARFGVSRGHIRDVLSHLAEMGVLERVRNRGTVIVSPPVEKIREELAFCFRIADYGHEDMKEARLQLELALIPLIVRRITPDIIEKINLNLEKQEKAVRENVSRETFDGYDLEFHMLLLEAARNQSLRIFSNILLTAFNPQSRRQISDAVDNATTLKEHRELFRIIRSGDADAAGKAMSHHISMT